MDADALISDYLGRLDGAAGSLPAERRAELEAEVREHIDTVLSEGGARDEVAVRNVLERLGRPEEIVAAESVGMGPVTASTGSGTLGVAETQALPRPMAQGWGAIEIIALLLLTVGSILLPFVGPLLGLVFVWLSDRWSSREKLIATAIVVVLLVLPFALFFGAATNGGFNGPQAMPVPETYAP